MANAPATDTPQWAVDLFNQYFQDGGNGQAQGTIPGVGATKSESQYYTVYMGSQPAASPKYVGKQVDAEGDRLPAAHQREVGYDQAMTLIYHDQVQKRFIDELIHEGVIKAGDFSWDDVEGWWQKAVDGAAKSKAFGGKNISPYDWISMYAGVNGLGGSGSANGGTGPSTRTDTSSNTQQIDDLDARAAANEAWTSLYGKDATGKQARALKAAINAYASAHPQITTTTSHDDGQGHTSSSSSTKGGLDSTGAQQIAQDQVKGAPGYGEFQAATTYFNALQQALGATASV